MLRKKEARMPTNWSRRFKNHVEKLKSRRHLPSGRGRAEPLAARQREGPVRRREAHAGQGPPDPRVRAHVRHQRRRSRRRRRSSTRRSADGLWTIVVAAGRGDRFGGPQAVRGARRQARARLVARRRPRHVATASCSSFLPTWPPSRAGRPTSSWPAGPPVRRRCAAGLPAVPADADVRARARRGPARCRSPRCGHACSTRSAPAPTPPSPSCPSPTRCASATACTVDRRALRGRADAAGLPRRGAARGPRVGRRRHRRRLAGRAIGARWSRVRRRAARTSRSPSRGDLAHRGACSCR